jgi:hypothetical protein
LKSSRKQSSKRRSFLKNILGPELETGNEIQVLYSKEIYG